MMRTLMSVMCVALVAPVLGCGVLWNSQHACTAEGREQFEVLISALEDLALPSAEYWQMDDCGDGGVIAAYVSTSFSVEESLARLQEEWDCEPVDYADPTTPGLKCTITGVRAYVSAAEIPLDQRDAGAVTSIEAYVISPRE